jgi:ketosteroid isomerase-like protein
VIGDLAVVQTWLAAVNDEDAAQLEALSSEQVEIIGPRGQGVMHRRVLGEWLARSGFRAEVRRWFCGGEGRVVVEQLGRWQDVATGHVQAQRVIGSEFTVRGGRVVRYVRHDSGVIDALAAAGLDEQRDLVPG